MKTPQKNPLEWIVFGVSCVLVLATVGFLAHAARTEETSPPQLEVTLGRAQARRDHFAVPVTVVNRGDQSAEQVVVRVTLASAAGKDQSAELQIAFLPRHSSRAGWVAFTEDPTLGGRLTAVPVGYEVP